MPEPPAFAWLLDRPALLIAIGFFVGYFLWFFVLWHPYESKEEERDSKAFLFTLTILTFAIVLIFLTFGS